MNKRKMNDTQVERGGTAYGRAMIAVGITAAVLVLAYLAGAFFFAGHYYWRTQIDGTDYSFRSKEQVREEILNPSVAYELQIYGREDMQDVVKPDQVGMTYVYDNTLDRINAQLTGLKWPMMFFGGRDFELPKAVTYSDDALAERLSETVFFKKANIHPPEDAYISGYIEGRGYEIVPEYPGTVADFDRVKDAVAEALEKLQETLDLDAGGFYQNAAVKSDDKALRKALEKANRYVGAVITYDWNGEREVVDGSVISQWITITDDDVMLDEEAAREYVNGLARKHDTYGRDRNFTTTMGNTILLKSGSYGWWTDRAGETAALLESVRKGEQVEKEPLYFARGYATGAPGEDIGASYVEIDMGNQHLYLYMNGELILESDFVSGNISRGYGTPAGVFGLTYKERNATLTGENYASHVDYWMPFNGNIGMHDASWRGSFGGDIYMRNGSHGCINLPRDKAEEIYGYMERNFPVICYY